MKRLLVLLVILGLFLPTSALGVKWSDLSELTTVASGDFTAIVDVSETPDESKKITWGSLMGAPGPIGGTTDSTGQFTYLGINVAAATYPFYMVMTAAQKTGIYVDGTTNDYTGADVAVVYDVKRDINRGTAALTNYAGQSNYLNLEHTNAQTGLINYAYANINRIDNDGNIINATAVDHDYHEYGTYSWIDEKAALYDTQSTGNIDVVLTGVQSFMETNSTNLGSEDGDMKFSDTGTNNPTNTLDVRGFKARMFHDPELLSGTLNITTTGFDATIISEPIETGGTLTQVTDGVKINIDADTAGTSTARGVYIEAVAGADTNYAIYSASAADSYLAGDLEVGSLTTSGITIQSYEAVSSTSTGVALSVTEDISNVTTNDDGDTDGVTLANGTAGQTKTVVLEVLTGTDTGLDITPASFSQGTKVTLDAAGQNAVFLYNAVLGWILVSTYGGIIS